MNCTSETEKMYKLNINVLTVTSFRPNEETIVAGYFELESGTWWLDCTRGLWFNVFQVFSKQQGVAHVIVVILIQQCRIHVPIIYNTTMRKLGLKIDKLQLQSKIWTEYPHLIKRINLITTATDEIGSSAFLPCTFLHQMNSNFPTQVNNKKSYNLIHHTENCRVNNSSE